MIGTCFFAATILTFTSVYDVDEGRICRVWYLDCAAVLVVLGCQKAVGASMMRSKFEIVAKAVGSQAF
jgi:hypothetical protein